MFSVASMLPNPMVNSQPILLNLSHSIWHSSLLYLLWHTSSLTFGRQHFLKFSSILLTFFFFFTGSPLLSKCWRTQTLVHFLSLVSFPSSSFLFPCVYSSFSIWAGNDACMEMRAVKKRGLYSVTTCQHWVIPGHRSSMTWHQKIQSVIVKVSWFLNIHIEPTIALWKKVKGTLIITPCF